jgi:hypothetical protein
MAPEAARLWDQVYSRLSACPPGMLGHVIARGEPQVLRLSLIYALLDRAEHVEKIHIEAALALWTFCAASAQLIFGDDPVADTIMRELRMAGIVGLSRTDILHYVFSCHMPAGKISEALAKLLAAGKVRRDVQAARGGGAGRPREVWFIV